MAQTETELKLSLRSQDLPRLLAHPLLVQQPAQTQRLHNTYFDTPELDLMRGRVAVRERRVGRRTLLTVKTAGHSVGGLSRRGEWEAPTTPGSPDFLALVSDTTLARELHALSGRLVPLFSTDFRRRRWLLTHGQAQIEVALDEGWIRTGVQATTAAGQRAERILELELELKAGPEAALFDLALALGRAPAGADGPWLMPAERSKAERGMALYLGQPLRPCKAQPLPLAPDLHPVTALRTALQEVLSQLQANVTGLLDARPAGTLPDPEYVHQARVAVRRLRSGLALFRQHLPKAFVRSWSTQWKAAAAVLGEARNRDVLDDRLMQWVGDQVMAGQSPDTFQPLADWSLDHRLRANQRVLALLESPAMARQLLGFAAALATLPSPPKAPALDEWARVTLEQRQQRLRRLVKKAHDLDAEGLHALRIRVKKLRYAQGFLLSVLPQSMQEQQPLLEQAQELMGELNDRVTALQLLRRCRQPHASDWRLQLEREQAQILQKLPGLQRALASPARR